MKRKTLTLSLVLLALIGLIAFYLDPSKTLMGLVRGETFFQNRPSSFWAQSLTSKDPATQAEALKKLTEAKAEAVPVLIELVETSAGSEANAIAVRTEALNLLTKAGSSDKKVIDTLLKELKDADPNLRIVAAKGFGTLQGELPDSAIPLLIDLLAGKEKVAPIRALSLFGNRASAAIPELRKLLADTDPEVRWNASRTLGKIGPASLVALRDLFPHLEDADEKVREHAAETVGQIGPEAVEGIPYLEKAMTDKHPRVRRDAIRSLGQLGAVAKASLPKMLPLLKDENDLVKEAARKAVRIMDPTIDVEGK